MTASGHGVGSGCGPVYLREPVCRDVAGGRADWLCPPVTTVFHPSTLA